MFSYFRVGKMKFHHFFPPGKFYLATTGKTFPTPMPDYCNYRLGCDFSHKYVLDLVLCSVEQIVLSLVAFVND